MIEKQKSSFWKSIDGIDTFKIDGSQISPDLIEQLPTELPIRNSKKEYLSLIKWFSGLYLAFVAGGLFYPKPFTDAYDKSPFWSTVVVLFPIAGIAFYLVQYFSNLPRVFLNKSGIKYKGEFVSWFSADTFELIHNSSNQTYSIVVKNKDNEILISLDVNHLELSPDRILITLKAFQMKCAK